MAKGDQMKEKILRAALKLFRKKGYLGTSMLDIAAEVGLTKGGIYHYIAKKEDLLRELHDEMVDAVFERHARMVDPERDPGRKLENWIRSHASIMHDYLAQITVFFTEMEHLDKANLKRTIQRRDAFHKALTDIIAEGIRAGQFKESIDPNVAALLILGTLNWYYQWYRPDGEFSIDELAEMTIQVICHGLYKESAKHPE